MAVLVPGSVDLHHFPNPSAAERFAVNLHPFAQPGWERSCNVTIQPTPLYVTVSAFVRRTFLLVGAVAGFYGGDLQSVAPAGADGCIVANSRPVENLVPYPNINA